MINFDDLKNRHCLLLDGTSVRLISEQASKKELTEKHNKFGPDWRALYSSRRVTRHALDVLSRVVVYDYLVVDYNALESLSIGETLLPNLIHKTEIPESLYRESWRDVKAGYYLQEHFPSRFDENKWFDHNDKHWMDRVCSLNYVGGIANSQESVARAFFYLDVARSARVPLLLSPSKADNLESIEKEVIPELFKKFQERIDAALMARVNAIFSADAKENAVVIHEPPLVDWIIRNAEAKGLSLADSALALRETKEAIAFRVWLKEIQADFSSGDRARILRAFQKAIKAHEYIKEWTQEANPQFGLTKVKRTLKLGKIPVVGWLFELANADNFTVSDPLLTAPEAHLAFIAKMYSEVAAKEEHELPRRGGSSYPR